MVFGQKLISDMVDGTPSDPKLGKANDHDRNNNDGRIKAESCSSQHAGENDPDGKVAEGHRQIAPQETENITQVGSFGHQFFFVRRSLSLDSDR